MKNKKRWFAIYSMTFAILCIIAFYPFYIHGKSFVWSAAAQDGLVQHLNSAAYWGQYIREFFGNLLHGQFRFPMWDMSIGYGGDILATLNYYAIGDPINLIYAFSNQHNMEYFYDFAMLLRMYLMGISFLIYGFYMKKNPYGILTGSYIYIFSGVVFRSGMRHPFFLNPMIYLPLLFLGVEKIYRKERPYLFVVTVAISAMSNFYFFYMLTVLTIGYALIRFFHYNESAKMKDFFCTVGRFSKFFALGIGLAAVILLPAIYGFLGNGRSGEGSGVNLLYPMRYYAKVLLETIGYSGVGRAVSLNYISLAAIAVVALFFQSKRENRVYKMGVIISGICLAFPICGYVLHGFSYPSNRWVFGLAFFVAFLVTQMYPMLFELSKKQKIAIVVSVCGYAGLILWLMHFKPKFSIYGLKAASLVFALTGAGILLINVFHISVKNLLGNVCIFGLVAVGTWVSGQYHFSPTKTDNLMTYIDSGKVYSILCNDEIQLLDSVKDSGLYRSETGAGWIYNYGLLNHIPNTSNYFSITDKNVAQTVKMFEDVGFTYMFKFRNTDAREGLLSLNGVKYRTERIDENGESKAPKEFAPIAEKNGYRLYENQNAMPFGYTYDSYITKKDFEQLNSVEKEQALLNHVLISEKNTNLKKGTVNVSVKNQRVMGQKVIKIKRGHPVYVTCKVPVDDTKDNYLRIDTLDYEPQKREKSKLVLPIIPNNEHLKIDYGTYKYNLCIQPKGSNYSIGDRSFTMKMKIKKGDKFKIVKLLLKKPGTYSFREISHITVDSTAMMKNIQKRKQSESLEHIQYDKGNHFSGEIKTKGTRMLCIPIPYSKGWKGTDHGKKVHLQKVNGMFMGMELKEGTHKIRLDYESPGLKAGALMTFISLCILGGMIIRKRK